MDSYPYFSLVFLTVSLFSFVLASQTQPSQFSHVFNVLKYGAIGNGKSNDTVAFQKAWTAACGSEDPSSPVVFLVPKNYSFMIHSLNFTGPCKSQLVFKIEGRLVAPDGPDSWGRNEDKRYWLVFVGIDGMLMEGGGVVDGNGHQWWNLPCKPHKSPPRPCNSPPDPCLSPFAITFFSSSNLTIRNLTIRNSPQKHFWFQSCTDVHIDSMHIKSPAGSPNTDGIHLYKCNHVKIHNSIIASGDDCVSIGGNSYNVDIKNITCQIGHGISIGSLGLNNTKECVSNITVRNSTIKHSDNGVRIKTWQGGSGTVSNVTFENIKMVTVRNPITINQYYCNSICGCPNQTSAVYITDISYKNIRGTYNATNHHEPVYNLACSYKVPCTNLTFVDVDLRPGKGQTILKPFCLDAYGDARRTSPLLDCLAGISPKTFPSVEKC